MEKKKKSLVGLLKNKNFSTDIFIFHLKSHFSCSNGLITEHMQLYKRRFIFRVLLIMCALVHIIT
ncbi:hypothetical protein BpHYR1_024809 [Brachionus plicatilis]|uniref:Uncharacterized protein n=1 Tax=Brachionus plicatilis TaxID=10195 RepID=A0A3M7RYG5_BRAPC|nr:hypothetical protein BpHYR1_024809 [Brachionus plicatilis]